jgi:hypothetical protein
LLPDALRDQLAATTIATTAHDSAMAASVILKGNSCERFEKSGRGFFQN